eukprot:Opistho-2@34215
MYIFTSFILSGGVKIIKGSDDDWKQTPIASIELPANQVGEIVVSGWQVNTYEVPASRILKDVHGNEWLRTGDAGYLDKDGLIWLVGRISWRVERDGKTYWSTVVEQTILDAFVDVTFAAYLPHEGKTHLFVETANPGSVDLRRKVQSLVREIGCPVDNLVLTRSIPRDRRHGSKPDPSKMFVKPLVSKESLVRYAPYGILLLFVLLVLFLRSSPSDHTSDAASA